MMPLIPIVIWGNKWVRLEKQICTLSVSNHSSTFYVGIAAQKVWPDWDTFETSWRHIILQNWPKY